MNLKRPQTVQTQHTKAVHQGQPLLTGVGYPRTSAVVQAAVWQRLSDVKEQDRSVRRDHRLRVVGEPRQRHANTRPAVPIQT